ncbi:histone acetylation protein-domain-containing protein [Cladorrhinum samala]|uniref:histone acetyltransferase n=1 Tax=Cladorrhinum samala TaxID=585594 RepID=A0AAV9HRV0_9PEZI|nr:histone acetylation protein-domain-containing protein [Cladorrhinum samala]
MASTNASSASKRTLKSTTATTPSLSSTSETLRERLATVLPQGYRFGIYHLSTPPTKTEPLCSAPPAERPDKTFGESHFLAVSIDADSAAAPSSLKRASPGADEPKPAEPRKQVLVFAVEIFIFTTAYSTTIFVGKADSTGYLHLLNLPKGTPSPIRQVCAAFISYLIEHRRRKNTQTIVNLFARSQAQYLFPGSVQNKGKHVLDDRGLVKWWCKVLNPLMEGHGNKTWGTAKGYLLVPGLEVPETRAFIPKTLTSTSNWVIGHPLELISHYTDEFDWVPPRCLIPRYPDDPKSRFRDELDEEVSKNKNKDGIWKWASVKTLEQFWEMMAYRQECSSGSLTGFIWLVFDSKEKKAAAISNSNSTSNSITPNGSLETPFSSQNPPSTPPRRRVDIVAQVPTSSKGSPLKQAVSPTSPTPEQPQSAKRTKDKKNKKKKKKLTGPVITRPPKVKRQLRNYLLDKPTSTAYYYWPAHGRGDKVVNESDYKRSVELLLHLDFSTLAKATASSRKWISQTGGGAEGWGGAVVGKAKIAENIFAVVNGNGGKAAATAAPVTNLTGLVRRKNTSSSQENNQGTREEPTVLDVKPVNILGAGLVRRKNGDGENGTKAVAESA